LLESCKSGNNMQITIKIHSIVDLITNSSTEIFTSVRQSAITEIKHLVNSLLHYAKSEETADDLFEFSSTNFR